MNSADFSRMRLSIVLQPASAPTTARSREIVMYFFMTGYDAPDHARLPRAVKESFGIGRVAAPINPARNKCGVLAKAYVAKEPIRTRIGATTTATRGSVSRLPIHP
jgi:hypothetical protein